MMLSRIGENGMGCVGGCNVFEFDFVKSCDFFGPLNIFVVVVVYIAYD